MFVSLQTRGVWVRINIIGVSVLRVTKEYGATLFSLSKGIIVSEKFHRNIIVTTTLELMVALKQM